MMFYRRLMTDDPPDASGGLRAVVLCRVQQFAGMCPASVGFAEPRQHAGEFGDPIVVL